MKRTLLWLLASLASAFFTAPTNGAPMEVLMAPNLLRVGTTENIFVECRDCTGGDIQVDIKVMTFPIALRMLDTTTVTLSSVNNFQALGKIMIPAEDFSRDPSVKQYVYLRAVFQNGSHLEKVVMVSFQDGYIFIQTDKTVYTPGSRVFYRIFGLTPGLEAAEQVTVAVNIETPDGIFLHEDTLALDSAMAHGFFALPKIVTVGLWKIVAKFHKNRHQSFSTAFEVKDYVLSSFEVKLTPLMKFFYVDSEQLAIRVDAVYLFGETVDGTAYVSFGVLQNSWKHALPSSLQRVSITNGQGEVTLRREHLTPTFPNVLDLVGSSIFVQVKVLTDSGSEMVEAELENIPIVTSPYTISFKNTPKYFKPGMVLDVTIQVTNPDKTPAQNIEVEVQPDQVRGFTDANGIARIKLNSDANAQRLNIQASTNDIRTYRQATNSMVVHPYNSESNSYIHIESSEAETTVGERLIVRFILNKNIQPDITFLVTSKGRLVKFGRFRANGQLLLPLEVTREMLPSFRIVAYYHTSNSEVVSDSVLVHVKDTCVNLLKLETSKPILSPGRKLVYRVTGDPGARVGLLSVNKGVHALNNQHQLTQKKVWDIVEESDTGCTPGGGRDAMHVFHDAGLMFQSNNHRLGTPVRKETTCQSSSRQRRSTATVDSMTTTRTATSRAARVPREEDGSFEDDIVYRRHFPESWLWNDITLPAGCAAEQQSCKSSSEKLHFVPDSITSWQLTGISLSTTNGICISEPLDVTVRKEFFIDLRLPYAAVQGEQIEVKAILHNLSPDNITVRVQLLEGINICSSAFRRGKYQQKIIVGAQTERAVSFIVIPLKFGEFPIAVKAAVKDSLISDGVQKMLRVVPSGTLIKSVITVVLNPTANGIGGQQVETLNSAIPSSDLAPGTPATTEISVTGSESPATPDLNVVIALPERQHPLRVMFNSDNYYQTRTAKVNTINKNITVSATGTGQATLKMVSIYYALPQGPPRDCKNFKLSVEFIPDREGEDVYQLRIGFFFKHLQRNARMTILEIGLLNGFTWNVQDLQNLSRGPGRVISRYDLNNPRGSLIFYLDGVSRSHPEEITFRMHQIMKHEVLQPAAVSVYEYDDKQPCVKFYHPERRNGQLLQLCHGNECQCAEEACPIKKSKAGIDERLSYMCASDPVKVIDFAYKVRVEEITPDASSDTHVMRIQSVIKEGTVDSGSLGKLRKFITFPFCRSSLDLRIGKTYLIIGTGRDVYVGANAQTYTYVFGQYTWVEYWPSNEECQSDTHRGTCLGLTELQTMYAEFGCRSK